MSNWRTIYFSPHKEVVVTDFLYTEEGDWRDFEESSPPPPPMPPGQHAVRIQYLERELVAEAVEHCRAWRSLYKTASAKERMSPLSEPSAVRQNLTVAVRSLIEFYADHGQTFTTYQMSKRVISITRAMPSAPSAMSSLAWRKFFELVAAVQRDDADSVAELSSSLTQRLSGTADDYWLERAAAYIVCMQQYEILEKTRV